MRGLKEVKTEQVMCWAGIIDDKLIGPYFFKATVTGETYLEMLGNYLIPELNILGINPDEIWFQQDGAPPHFSKFVRHWLDENFPRWIGRAGPVEWAPRSPDLTKMDFFLWGFTKHNVYKEQPSDIEDLKNKICAAFALVTPETLRRVETDTIQRLNLCIARGGAHIEHVK